MAIDNQIYDTSTLLGVMNDKRTMDPPSNYWLDLCFGSVLTFDDEYIDFSQISSTRKLAPLVVPTAQGKPIYSAAERLTRVKPAYVKPKDPVTASRMLKRSAGLGELGTGKKLTPAQRYQAIVTDILKQHRHSIERRWEWLAAEAVIHGRVTLEDEAYPKTVVDFQRDAGNTIALTAGNYWGDAGVSIVDSVQGFKKIVRDAKFGGPTNRLTVGSDVWEVMRKDDELKELLNTNYRQDTNASLNLGLREGLDVEWVGKLASTLDVWVYSDYYQLENGDTQPFMSPKDVVLTGANVDGVRCFGAIADKRAGFQPLPVFPKMWDAEDPSVTQVMTQSAPLMVPVNPNNTLRATVIA